jgi:hypothetical protein
VRKRCQQGIALVVAQRVDEASHGLGAVSATEHLDLILGWPLLVSHLSSEASTAVCYETESPSVTEANAASTHSASRALGA